MINKKSAGVALIIMLGFSVAACIGAQGKTACAAEPKKKQRSNFPVVISDPASPLESIEILTDDGGRVDWSENKNLIAFDRRGADGFYDVHTMNPDGTDEQCLTCNLKDLPKKHTGNPAWHPSGNYSVVQSQKRFQIFSSYWSEPGRGFNNDLWLISGDGKNTYKLRTVNRRMGVLHPHFSHDGSKLFWSEKTGSTTWALKLAGFVADASGPRLENIKTYTPGAGLFYESHEFSNDDRGVLFSGNLDGQDLSGIDIHIMDIETERLVNLTSSPEEWDEHAQYTRSGEKIIWMSSKGCNCNPKILKELRTDIWIMNADGSGKTRLTYFNEPGHEEYIVDGIVVGDMSFSPDGKKLVAYLILQGTGLPETTGKIALITFKEPL